MIKKHWILRDYHPDSINLKELCDEFNNFGYESVLFTVYSRGYDMWTRVANAISEKHTFKYMMAVRPYLFSPQYLAMLVSSFQKLSNDRVILNMVHGTIRDVETFDGIVDLNFNLLDPDERKRHLLIFLDAFKNNIEMSVKFKVPEIIISGQSDQVLEAAKANDANIALWHDMFIANPERILKNNFNKVYISTYILVTETDKEAESIINSLPEERRSAISLYGSKETLKNKIIKLSEMGVTDIIFSQYGPTFDRLPIHEFLLELTKEGILS